MCENMYEQEISKKLLELREWEKNVDTNSCNREGAFFKEIVGIVADENLKSDIKAEFNEILDTVEKELNELSVLRTLGPRKVKDKVV